MTKRKCEADFSRSMSLNSCWRSNNNNCLNKTTAVYYFTSSHLTPSLCLALSRQVLLFIIKVNASNLMIIMPFRAQLIRIQKKSSNGNSKACHANKTSLHDESQFHREMCFVMSSSRCATWTWSFQLASVKESRDIPEEHSMIYSEKFKRKLEAQKSALLGAITTMCNSIPHGAWIPPTIANIVETKAILYFVGVEFHCKKAIFPVT